MWISRYFNQIVARTLREYPAVIMTGARQTGKTSLLKHIFPDYNYVSLDNPSAALQAQYAPEIFRYIKIAIDESDGQRNSSL